MSGMNAATGSVLSGIAHLRQSIRDILTTPIGSRIMRREYGSNLFRLVDSPLSQGLLTDIYAATAEALDRWEPRFRLSRVWARQAGPGHLSLDLEGEYLVSGESVRLEGVLIQ